MYKYTTHHKCIELFSLKLRILVDLNFTKLFHYNVCIVGALKRQTKMSLNAKAFILCRFFLKVFFFVFFYLTCHSSCQSWKIA